MATTSEPFEPAFSVVIPTHTTDEGIERAIRSAWSQTVGPVEIIVVGDDIDRSAELDYLVTTAVENNARLRFATTHSPNPYRASRAANARNVGWAMATAPWVAFLDHDNEFEPDHLENLKQTLDTHPEAEAANSAHFIITAKGAPWRPNPGGVPWRPDAEDARRVQHRLVGIGNLTIGSNVVFSDLRRPRTTVDSNTWIVRRDLLSKVHWPTRYTKHEREIGLNEDRAFSDVLRRRGIHTISTHHPSVRYFLPPGSGHTASASAHRARFRNVAERSRPWIASAAVFDDHVQLSPQLIAEFPNLANSPEVVELRSTLGFNDCYQVVDPDGQQFVLKWPSFDHPHDRCVNEADCLSILNRVPQAAPRGIASNFRQGVDGPVIQEFCNGEFLRGLADDRELLRNALVGLARTLRRIDVGTRRQGGFAGSAAGSKNQTWSAEVQARALQATAAVNPTDTERLRLISHVGYKLSEIATVIERLEIKPSLCNLDLHPSNVLVEQADSGAAHARVFDWEWGNWSDPVVNLDYTIHHYLLDDAELALDFFVAYGGVPERLGLRADIALGLRILRCISSMDGGGALTERVQKYEAMAIEWMDKAPGAGLESITSTRFQREVEFSIDL